MQIYYPWIMPPFFYLILILSSASAAPLFDTTNLERRSSNSTSTTPVLGWVSSPDGRGTIDIVWSCVSTTFLCSWTVLCLNVPALGDGPWHMFRRKIYLSGLAVIGPEFLFQIAL